MRIAQNQTLLLGPPGTGKTTRLLAKVEEFLERGYRPEDIALLSFTKKAVAEAKERASKKFNLPERRFSLFNTIHAFTFHALGCTKQSLLGKQNYMELGAMLGYDMTGFTGDMEEGLQSLSNATPGDRLLFLENMARVKCISLRQAWSETEGEISWDELVSFTEGYNKYKMMTGLMDFTDLLTKYAEEGRPSHAKIVFIDEAQDLSLAQWRVLERAFSGAEYVIIAGDDDQSIYKWSGADLQTFLHLDGEREVLGHSYRLPKSVYRLANRIIHQVARRFSKEFTPTERVGVVDYVADLEFAKINPNETTLILVRNIFLLKGVYEHLRRLGYTYTGRGHVRSVPQQHVQAIVAWENMRKGHAISYSEALEMYEHLRVGRVLERGGKGKLGQSEDIDVGYTFETLRDHYGLLSAPVWHEALEGIPLETRDYYQTVLRAGRKISHEPRIMVNTIHGVKGGEADHVIVVSDMTKKTFDSYQKDPDSEHRVAFVAVTRAKERLTIVLPRSRYAYQY